VIQVYMCDVYPVHGRTIIYRYWLLLSECQHGWKFNC